MMLLPLFFLMASTPVIGLENNDEYSHLELTANPGIIHPILTKNLQLRCSVKNITFVSKRTTSNVHKVINRTNELIDLNETLDQSDESEIQSSAIQISNSRGKAEFSRLLSLVLSKRNKQTGLNETIASVTECDSPVIESKYNDTVQVEGNAEGSTREGELGFITLTWTHLLEEHSGEFYCEASALNSEKHSVTLEASLEIQAVEPKIFDLVNYISTNDKHIFDLKSKVSELYEENQYLKNQTTVLAREDEDMKYTLDQIKNPTVRSGSITCTNTVIQFKPAFNNTPKVFTSYSSLAFTTYSSNGVNYNFKMSVQNVTNTQCQIYCSTVSPHGISASFDWMAIGF